MTIRSTAVAALCLAAMMSLAAAAPAPSADDVIKKMRAAYAALASYSDHGTITTEDKPVGFVCFHARTADGKEMSRSPVIPGGRDDIRERSALVGLHMLRVLLGDAPSPI